MTIGDDSSITPAMLTGLSGLTHHRWAIPLIAECDRAELKGCKYVTFLHRLGISRDSLGRTLAATLEQGWIMKNPGAGHPLRPEYILTPSGIRIGAQCRRLMATLVALEALEIGLNKWSLPALVAVAAGSRRGARFAQIGRLLPEATSRALALTLKQLTDAGIVERTVLETFPPTSEYRVTKQGRRTAATARGLARVIGTRLGDQPSGSSEDRAGEKARKTA